MYALKIKQAKKIIINIFIFFKKKFVSALILGVSKYIFK